MNFWYMVLIAGILGAVAVFLTDYKIQIGKEKKKGRKLDKIGRLVDKIGSIYLFFLFLIVLLIIMSILILFIYLGYSTGKWTDINFSLSIGIFLTLLMLLMFVYNLRKGNLNFWRKEK